MKQILKTYGQFLLEGMAVVCIMILWLEQGVFKEIGDNLPVATTSYDTYEDFRKVYRRESEKEAPEIAYVKESIHVGSYLLSELVEAYDYADRKLSIKVHSILNPKKEELVDVYNMDTAKIEFDMTGIYIIEVSAVDDGNRQAACTIKIPVNK